MRTFTKALLFFSVLLTFPGLVVAEPLEQWNWRNPLPQGNSLAAVSFIEGRFVAVGAGGTILQSTDGWNWAVATTPTRSDLSAVSGGEGTMAAVGTGGTVVTSADGANWALQTPPTTKDLSAVAYGNGRFVAVGYYSGPIVLASTNGISWTNTTPSGVYEIQCVAYGNGTFVIGARGARLTSQDGITWTSTDTSDWTFMDMEVQPAYVSMIYAGGAFVASSPDARLLRSPSDFPFVGRSRDGRAWTSVGSLAPPWGPFQLAFGNGHYFGVDSYGTNVMTSADGLNWSLTGTALPFAPLGLAFGNGRFAAVGGGGATATSPDGTNWVQHSASPAGMSLLSGFAAFGDRTVLVGSADNYNAGVAFRSTNGISFAAGSLPAGTLGLTAVACSPTGKLVAVGNSGELLTSDDGLTWSNRNSAAKQALWGIAYGGNRFVAVGRLGTVTVSSDGSAWALRPSPTSLDLRGATYGNGTWVAVGQQGSLFTSGDSAIWDPQNSSTTVDLCCVHYANGMFVACGDKGTIVTSPNGTTWTLQASGVDETLLSVHCAQGVWLAVGSSGTILSSTDATLWTRRPSPTAYPLYGAGFNYGSFFAVGSQGVVLQSGSLDTLLIRDYQRLQNGTFVLSVIGPVGAVCRLQATPTVDSTNWTDIQTFTNVNGVTTLEDATAVSEPARLYRVTIP